MDTNVVVALATCGISILGCLASAALVIWRGGTMIGKVQVAIDRLSKIEVRLDDVHEMKISIGMLKTSHEALHSDHRELREEQKDMRRTVDRLRDRFPSTVDEQEY